VLFAAAAVWALASRRHELADALRRLSLGSVAGAIVLALLAVFAMLMSWVASVRDGTRGLTIKDLARIYFVGQMGKYVPGSVWPVLTQSLLARRRGASPGVVATGSLLNLALSVCVSLFLGGLLLPLAPAEAKSTLFWVPFVLIPMGALLHPAVLNRLLPLAARVLRRGQVGYTATGPAIARSACWAALGGLLFGAHLYMLVSAVGRSGPRELALATCAYNLAAATGVLVIFVPAGAGVREAVLTAVLAPVLDVTTALAVALVSRATLVAIDLTLGGLLVPGLRAWSAAVTDQSADP
jgi:uncharacterized membrane protein YbhN (UPF0104 family)